MIAPPPAVPHHGTAPVFHAGESTGECAAAIGAYYREHFENGLPPRIVVATDGPYALVGWQWVSGGGMDLFRRFGTAWCRVAVGRQSNAGRVGFTPSTWLTEADLTGLPALDGKRARRLLAGPFVTEAVRAGSPTVTAQVGSLPASAGVGSLPTHAVTLARTAGFAATASQATVSFRRVVTNTHATTPARPACARSLAAALPRWAPVDPIVHVAIAQDAAHALVGVSRRETGGMYLYRRAGSEWCLVTGGGGAMAEADLIGIDGIDRKAARALFDRLRAGGVADVR